MSARVRVERGGDGRLRAVKEALGPADHPRLVHEAMVLTVASHPGVVPLHGLRAGAHGLELLTTWVGARSLADLGALPPREVAGLVAAVADTVADLHQLGIVHGRLDDPSHVLFDASRRPVLCGFGHAALTDHDAAAHPSLDVAGLGRLLEHLLDPSPALEPPRGWRWRGVRHDESVRRALLTLADHARADDRSCRPAARGLAASLQQLAAPAPPPRSTPSPDPPRAVPSGAPPGDPLARLRASATGPGRVTDRDRWRRGVGFGAASAVVVGLVIVAVAVFDGPRADGAATPARSAVPPAPAPAPAPSSTLPRDPSGPPVVEVDGARYVVGRPGDEVLVDDLACDGGRRAAVVRPSTGEVFVFDRWADDTTDVVATPVAELGAGARLHLDRSDATCPRLVGVRADGTAVALGGGTG